MKMLKYLKNVILFMIKEINPYINNIFGKWFKNIVLILLLIPSIFFFCYGVYRGWIDKEFGLQIFFLILGIIIGRWIEK
jgi:hypothetical protein